MVLALNNLEGVGMLLNKETKPNVNFLSIQADFNNDVEWVIMILPLILLGYRDFFNCFLRTEVKKMILYDILTDATTIP